MKLKKFKVKKSAKTDRLLNYLIIVQPDQRTGTNEPCFSVQCPTFGLADNGDTVEEAIENMKELIKFHLECLIKEGEPIPREKLGGEIIGRVQINVPSKVLRFIPA